MFTKENLINKLTLDLVTPFIPNYTGGNNKKKPEAIQESIIVEPGPIIEAIVTKKEIPTPNQNFFAPTHDDQMDFNTTEVHIDIQPDTEPETKLENNPEFKELLVSLTMYMMDHINIEPLPDLIFIEDDVNNAKNMLGRTAHYNHNDKSITLYTCGRHPKDILRSYAHEMIHHKQNLEGRLQDQINTQNINEDDYLKEIEEEAYRLGNGLLFRGWENSIKGDTQINEVYILDLEKYNHPRTIQQNLWYTLNEITLTTNNAAEIFGDLTGGNFIVGDQTYSYVIKSMDSPYGDLGRLWNIQFHPEENTTSTPQGGKENYIKILSTMYKIIVDFAEKEKPEYIGIASLDNNRSKNYHSVYANLTDNKHNRIPGYFRKDVSLRFSGPNGSGKMVVLKRKDN